MTLYAPLEDMADSDTVDNVCLFISDSVRYDYIPDKLRELGVTARAIAPSTFTGSSLPSLLTGQYPSTHHLWSFTDELDSQPSLFTGPETAVFDYDDDFNPLQVSTFRSPPRASLAELDSPFVYVYHDPGGHLPYGDKFDNYGNVHSFLKQHSDPSKLRDLYSQSVSSSVARFEHLIADLEQRNELSNTLLVFISDHGEILGEHGGLFTHAAPMVPELVEIPVVFAGAGLSKGKEVDQILSGTDIAPTILSALGREEQQVSDGCNLWRETPNNDRLVRSEVMKKTKYDWLKPYAAGSVWDQNGGYVSHSGSQLHRLLYLIGVHLVKGPHSSITRNSLVKGHKPLIKAHLPAHIEYGSPDFTLKRALKAIPKFEQSASTAEQEVNRERLRQLGYLE